MRALFNAASAGRAAPQDDAEVRGPKHELRGWATDSEKATEFLASDLRKKNK